MKRLKGKCIVQRIVKNKSNEIEKRISTTNLMLGADFIEIDPSCTYLVKALDLAEYDKEGKPKDDTKTLFTDALDAFYYSWIRNLTHMRNIILRKQI